MHTIIKTLRTASLILLMGICMNTMVNAQSPADDPGIGGPGSPGNGPSGDDSPTVPFDGGMRLVLLVGGVAYGFVSLKKKGMAA